MSPISYDKKRYDEHRKNVCDEKGHHKPNHCATITICLLEDILKKIEEISIKKDVKNKSK